MIHNKRFNRATNYSKQPAKNQFQILNQGSVRIAGIDVAYFPRVHGELDPVIGEDPMVSYPNHIVIEMKLVNDFKAGDPDQYGVFGYNIKDTVKLSVAAKTWDEVINKKWQHRYTYVVDDIIRFDTNTYKCTVAGQSGKWEPFTAGPDIDSNFIDATVTWIAEGTAEADNDELATPGKGDLIYFPKTRALYKIQFVEDEDTYYAFDEITEYVISCELYNYSHENIAIEDVDGVEAGTDLGNIATAMDNIFIGVRNQLEWTINENYLLEEIMVYGEFEFKALNAGTSGAVDVFTGVDENTPIGTQIVDNDITWELIAEDDAIVTAHDINKKEVDKIIEQSRSEESGEFDDFL